MTPDGDKGNGAPTTAHDRTTWTDGLIWGAVLALAIGYGIWHKEALSQFAWKYDEGIYLQEALLQLQGHRLYVDIWSERPPLFSWMLAAAFSLWDPSVVVGRAVVLGTAVLAIPSLAMIARRLSDSRLAAVIAPLLLVSFPHFHSLSARLLIELPPVSLALLALALVLQYQKHPHLIWPALAAPAFASSLLIKPVTVPFYAPLILLLWQGIRQAASTWRLRWLLLAGFHGVMTLPVGIVMLYYGPRVFLEHIVGTLFAMREAHALSLSKNWQVLCKYFLADKWGLAYPWLVALAALGGIVLLARRRRWSALVLAVWMGGVLAALMLHTPVRRYHLFSLVPALIVPTAVALTEPLAALTTWPRLDGKQRGLVLTCALGLIWCTAGLPSLARTVFDLHVESVSDKQQTPIRQAAIRFLQQQTPSDSVILSDDPMLAYKAQRPIPPLLAAPSYKRVEAGELEMNTMLRLEERFAPSAIIFWERRFERIPGYADWVEERYTLAHVSEDEQRIFLTTCPVPVEGSPISTEAGLGLLGARVNELRVESGETLTVDLLLTADRPLERDYTLTLNLLDPDGDERWGQIDLPPLDRVYPTSMWRPGERVLQSVDIDVSPEASAGEKVLMLGFYVYGASGELLPLRDAAAPDNLIRLPERPVVRWPAVYESPSMQTTQSANLSDLARLVGYDLSNEVLQGGKDLGVTLYWQCLQEMSTRYTVFVHLLDEDCELVAQSDTYPGDGQFPTTGWIAGEYITDRHTLPLPSDLPEGRYRLAVGLYDLNTKQRLKTVGEDQPQDHVLLNTP
ncbi:MAG: ArnT family glycosyltransferase, partial [Anaerolineales bacterium]